MSKVLEDYGLISDLQTAALVSKSGSIDWLCVPRFDSAACFAALVGDESHGCWALRPRANFSSRWRYLPETLILETIHETSEGAVRVLDWMPVRGDFPDIIRWVEGLSGSVEMEMDFALRMDFGERIPWLRQTEHGVVALAGPDCVRLDTDLPLRLENERVRTTFSVKKGEKKALILTWVPSHEKLPERLDASKGFKETKRFWEKWCSQCTYEGPHREAVLRSLMTLKGLIYKPTGGIVAAPTTSLPERIGGVRNWDYRFCWIRDATFTLYAFMRSGYVEEAEAWREWVLRAIAGKPERMQIMYGLAGERRLNEYVADWLPGYDGSRPVRVGNAAYGQYQLDVYGELMDTFHFARRVGQDGGIHEWDMQRELLEFLEANWDEPDQGIWEVRGPRRHFTYSKVMAWVAFDRAVKAVDRFGLEGPVDRWRTVRQTIHEQVCDKGFNRDMGSFVQYYGSKQVDASLLLMPLVGFISPDHPMARGTVEAIQKRLSVHGLIRRYATEENVDGLPGEEGVFIACTLWLVDNLIMQGRGEEAHALFDRVLSLRNELGLLAEQYCVGAGRMVGNYPQAFSHLALINSAYNLARGLEERESSKGFDTAALKMRR